MKRGALAIGIVLWSLLVFTPSFLAAELSSDSIGSDEWTDYGRYSNNTFYGTEEKKCSKTLKIEKSML